MSESTTAPVAIVTGASSGVGRATAALLAEAGYRVALLARRAEGLRETTRQIRETIDHTTAIELPTDVTDPAAIDAAVKQVAEQFGRIDAVVNAAGDAPFQPIEKITPEIWQRCIDTNLSSVVHMTRAVWPTFKRQQRGVIVNVSSMSSIDPFRGFSIYAAAKIGVNMFTRCTADEGAAIGVRAVAVAPGAIETPMLRQNFSEKVLPKHKTLPPVEVASVIRDCVTAQRAFEPGETIILASP